MNPGCRSAPRAHVCHFHPRTAVPWIPHVPPLRTEPVPMNINELKSKSTQELVRIGGDLEVEGAPDLGKDALVERIIQRQVERGGQQYATGVLDVVEDGFGFMRRRGLMPSPDDIY